MGGWYVNNQNFTNFALHTLALANSSMDHREESGLFITFTNSPPFAPPAPVGLNLPGRITGGEASYKLQSGMQVGDIAHMHVMK